MEHFSHEHKLSIWEVMSEEIEEAELCSGCSDVIIQGTAYKCEICIDKRFYLHKSCAELPPIKKQHPLHPQHDLVLLDRPPFKLDDFVCEECRDICPGFGYHCTWCQFSLDVKCACLSDEECKLILSSKDANLRTRLDDDMHYHTLTLVNYKAGQVIEDCYVCELPVSDLAYRCYDCRLYVHESCSKIPEKLLHPFHLQHRLIRHHTCDSLVPPGLDNEFFRSKPYICTACKLEIKNISFSCAHDNFSLHFLCSKLSSALMLKHKSHQHNLVYFSSNTADSNFKCDACESNCNASFYRCVMCDFNLHLDCIPIPKLFQYDRHSHPLTLMDPNEHLSDVCDDCELARDPRHHFYYCQDCDYFSHIECVLNERCINEEFGSKGDVKEIIAEEWKQNVSLLLREAQDPMLPDNKMTFDYFGHDHGLTYYEDTKHFIKCQACFKQISGPCYYCEVCENFYLHKSCSELPKEMLHPLHSHPLTLTFDEPPRVTTVVCDRCRDLCKSSFYHCKECLFSLDIKCSNNTCLPDDRNLHIKEKKLQINTWSHTHALTLVNLEKWQAHSCSVCKEELVGLAYTCIWCMFFVHETCAEQQAQLSSHPFHPQHPLILSFRELGTSQKCIACQQPLDLYSYCCKECNFQLHPRCATSLKYILQHKCHNHNLVYFPLSIPTPYKCSVCGKSGFSYINSYCNFYRCVECRYFDVHIDCMPLPQIAKCECHVHPLTLLNSFEETDKWEDNRCDVCEEFRDSRQHVYCCDECTFTAHIHCVLSGQEQSSLENN